jgi:hypothetical protein
MSSEMVLSTPISSLADDDDDDDDDANTTNVTWDKNAASFH